MVRKDLVEMELEPGVFKDRKAWLGRERQAVWMHLHMIGFYSFQYLLKSLSPNFVGLCREN